MDYLKHRHEILLLPRIDARPANNREQNSIKPK